MNPEPGYLEAEVAGVSDPFQQIYGPGFIHGITGQSDDFVGDLLAGSLCDCGFQKTKMNLPHIHVKLKTSM